MEDWDPFYQTCLLSYLMAMENPNKQILFSGRLGSRRFIRADDFATILLWRSQPSTYLFTKSGKLPKKAEHFAWSINRVASIEEEPYFAYLIDEEMVAVTRLEKLVENTTTYEIGILVKGEMRKQGIASQCILDSIEFASNFKNLKSLVAWIHKENFASIKLFERCGFKYSNVKSKNFLQYFLKL